MIGEKELDWRGSIGDEDQEQEKPTLDILFMLFTLHSFKALKYFSLNFSLSLVLCFCIFAL